MGPSEPKTSASAFLGLRQISALVTLLAILWPPAASAQDLGVNERSFLERIESWKSGSLLRDEEQGIYLNWVPPAEIFTRLAELQKLDDLEIVFRNSLSVEHYKTIGELADLDSLKVLGAPTPPEALEHIGRLKNLHTLEIQLEGPYDERLEALRGLQKLERLRLYGGRYTREGIAAIAELKQLGAITLAVDELTVSMAEAIATLENLDALSIDCTRTSAEAIKKLSACPSAKRMYLSGPGFTAEAMAEFSSPSLRFLFASDAALASVLEEERERGKLYLSDSPDDGPFVYIYEPPVHPGGDAPPDKVKLQTSGFKEHYGRPKDATIAGWSVTKDGNLLALGRSLVRSHKVGSKSGVTRIGWIDIFDARSGKSVSTIDYLGPVTRVAFLSDSKTLIYRASSRRNEDE
jgi:hypothetical protein